MIRYADRAAAGAAVGHHLEPLDLHAPLLVGLARGGVPVAVAAARRVHGEVVAGVVRKITTPDAPEAALGAVGSVGEPVWFDRALASRALSPASLAEETADQRAEARRREEAYGGAGASWRSAAVGRDVVLVDDGIATGMTVLAALRALESVGPARLVLAVPVASPSAVARLGDAWGGPVVAVARPAAFRAVGDHYVDFAQLTDADVVAALAV